jgi:predicted DNA-binding ribbon-helix-helix protein
MLALSDLFKDVAAETYGEPPYGHAEQSTLKSYCKKMGLNLEETIQKLNAAGYSIESSALQIKQIATQNNVSPQQLLLPLTSPHKSPESNSNGKLKIPDDLSGVGRLTLLTLKQQYNIDIPKIIASLKAKGISLDESTKLKEIAEAQDISAHDLFDQIRDIHNQYL